MIFSSPDKDRRFNFIYSSNVSVPTTNCPNNSEYVIRSIVDLNEKSAVGNELYFIEYYVNDTANNQQYGGLAVIDNDGTKPSIGPTGQCGFLPTMKGKGGSGYVWLGVSTANYDYRYHSLDLDDFFALPDVQAAAKVLKSVKVNI